MILAVMGHGRFQYLVPAMRSICEHIGWGTFDRTILSLDGGAGPLPENLPAFDEVHRLPERSGLTANLAQLWKALDPDDWVFHVEEDFLVGPDCPLEDMRATLDRHPVVANMVLLRQPWSPEERAAGSVLNVHPQLYVRHDNWVEHVRGFWFNPCLYHASIREVGAGTEAEVTERLEGRTFGYWGSLDDKPRVMHIGAEGMGSPGWLK